MSEFDAAALLEHYARKVERIRGACHRNPDAFVEDKSQVLAEMRADVRRLRRPAPRNVERGTFRPGVVTDTRGRRVLAEIRKAN